MKKNILKCITTIMLALTLCTTTITHDTLPLQDIPIVITEQSPNSPIIDKPIPRD